MSKHSQLPRSLGGCLPSITGEALKKRGFGEFKILNEWERVVGPHLARHSAPMKLVFERGKSTEGSLHIQVNSAMALEFQHLQPMILDRIATYFGYRAVGRLVLLQTQQSFSPLPEKPAAVIPVSPEHERKLAFNLSELSSCEDETLRESLRIFAQTVFSTHPK